MLVLEIGRGDNIFASEMAKATNQGFFTPRDLVYYLITEN